MATREKNSDALGAMVAMFLAWIVPGAGHVYAGRVVRGAIIFVTISAMFWTGIAIGGVMTVDYQTQRWWFIAEMCAGVHGMIGWQRQKRVYEDADRALAADERFLDATRGVNAAAYQRLHDDFVDQWLAEKNKALVEPAGTVARAYAGVAGMLNILCVFDAMILVVMGAAEPKREDRDEEPDPEAKR